MMSELSKVKLGLKGIREYAKNKGVAIASLTVEEKQLYIDPEKRGKGIGALLYKLTIDKMDESRRKAMTFRRR